MRDPAQLQLFLAEQSASSVAAGQRRDSFQRLLEHANPYAAALAFTELIMGPSASTQHTSSAVIPK